MSWTYFIPTGAMLSPFGDLAGTGYAGGNLGKVPAAINNPDYCGVKNTGPLPPGHYQMVELVPQSHLGPNAIRLEPVPDENGSLGWMLGRAGFYIHADLEDRATHPRSASEGCIVMDSSVRSDIWNSGDHNLDVVVKIEEVVMLPSEEL